MLEADPHEGQHEGLQPEEEARKGTHGEGREDQRDPEEAGQGLIGVVLA